MRSEFSHEEAPEVSATLVETRSDGDRSLPWKIEQTDDHLKYSKRWTREASLRLVVTTMCVLVLPTIFVMPWYCSLVKTMGSFAATLPVSLTLSAVMIYGILATFYNRSEVWISNGRLTSRCRPFPLAPDKSVSTEDITQVFCGKTTAGSGEQRFDLYVLYAILNNRVRIGLFNCFKRDNAHQFESEIKSFLVLPDARVNEIPPPERRLRFRRQCLYFGVLVAGLFGFLLSPGFQVLAILPVIYGLFGWTLTSVKQPTPEVS